MFAYSKNKPQIGRSLVLITVFVVFARVAGAAREMAIAYRYSVTERVDAYGLGLMLYLYIISNRLTRVEV